MKKKALALALSMVLAVSALAGCGGEKAKETEAAKETTKAAETQAAGETKAPAETQAAGSFKGTIKLGGLAPMTGNYAEYGKGFQIGFQKAIDEINAAGGANGYKLEIEIKDTQGDPVVSTTMATDFAENDEIMALLGDFTSGACKANAQVCDSYEIVQLSPTASAPDYASMSKYFFGIMGRQDVEAPFLAKYILSKYLNVKKAAVIRVDSDWGQACYDNFAKQAEKEGIEVVVDKYQTGEKDFSSLITKMQAENPEVLIVMDQGDAVAAIFNQADSAGWKVQHVALGPGTSEQVVKQLIDNNNLIVTSPFFFNPDDAVLSKWASEFEAEAGFAPTIHPACAYDCVYLIKQAIEYIGDGEVTRNSIQEALANMPAYTGITGEIQFTEDGDISRQYMICGIEDGKWKVLEGYEYGADGI